MNTNSFFGKRFLAFLTLGVVVALLSAPNALARSGWLDTTFGTNGVVTADLGSDADAGRQIVLQTDGKIILAGYSHVEPNDPDDPYDSGSWIILISRYNSDGSPDTTFGINGKITVDNASFSGSKVALQSDGKLIVGGKSGEEFAVIRYNSDGSLDTTFGTNGMGVFDWSYDEIRQDFSDMTIQPNGKIVIVGDNSVAQANYTDFVFARFNSDGTSDISDLIYSQGTRYNSAEAVAIQSDGKIVISGYMQDDDGHNHLSLIRLKSDGTLDKSAFGKNGLVDILISGYFQNSGGALTLQSDGKIVVAGGEYVDHYTNENLVITRFNKNGTLDKTFNKTGIVRTDFGAQEEGRDVHLQADGKILVVGTSSTFDSDSLLIVRYNKDGSLDKTFGDNGKLIGGLGEGSSSGREFQIQPDGKVVVTGSSNGDAFLARYIVATTVTTTFKSAGAYDGWVLESAEDDNLGGSFDKTATTFNVGDDQRDRQYKGFISFNTSTLPDKAVITSAQLSVKRQGVVGVDPFTTHDDLLVDIRNSAFSNNVVLQTADFSAAASQGATQELIPPTAVNNWYTINLSSANLDFVSKVGVTQFRLFFKLDDDDDLTADYVKFFSGNSTSANMPQLIITYYVP
jgi:uncharacterized delta-60 repeat protein